MIYNKPKDISFAFLPKVFTQKKKNGKTKNNKLKAGSFFLLLYAGAVIAFILPLRPTYSEVEKRYLKEFPEFSIETLASGAYFSDISTWFSDTFPFRETLTNLNDSIKNLYGIKSISIHGDVAQGDEIPDAPLDTPQTTESADQTTVPLSTEPPTFIETEPPTGNTADVKTESLGAILVAGNSAYEYYNFSNKLAPDFINAVSNIKNASHGKSNIYTLLVPTSIDITLEPDLRKSVNSSDQKKALEYFNASFRDVNVVTGIYESQLAHKDEYTYFRTDHHWTALGAYYGYEQFAKAKGITPVPISQYQTVTYDGFLGSFYSSSKHEALGKTPDSVVTYIPFNNVTCQTLTSAGGVSDKWVLTDVSNYSASMKYLTFIGGDNPLVTIENHDNPQGETCILIKESYGNAFVPFLIPHYKTIYVIDPRHYQGKLSDFTADKDIDDIVFISNISTTRNSIFIRAMQGFIQ